MEPKQLLVVDLDYTLVRSDVNTERKAMPPRAKKASTEIKTNWAVAGYLSLLSAAAILAALNFQNGHSPTDDGWMLGLAWRVVQWEIPYRDFIYIRPPLSPLLATAWFVLPYHWIFRAARCGFFFLMALPALFAWREFIKSHLKFSLGTIGPLCLTISFYLFACSQALPTPWHTVDALIFTTIAGGFSLNHPNWKRGFAAGLFCGLAALCKQNFAIIIPVIALRFLIPQGAKKKAWIFFLLGGAGPFIALMGFLSLTSSSDAFRDQVFGGSQSHHILNVIKLYLNSPGLLLLGVFIGCIAARPPKQMNAEWVRTTLPIACTVYFLVTPDNSHRPSFFVFWIVVGIFLGNVGTLIPGKTSHHNQTLAMLCLFALIAAFAASISIGYPFPTLALALLSAPIIMLMPSPTHPRANLLAGILLIASMSMTCWRFLATPYQEMPRDSQTMDLAKVVPKFGRMWTNPKNYGRFLDLDTVFQKYKVNQSSVVVMPEFPHWYFLHGIKNPVSLDWIQPTEIANQANRLIDEFDKRVNFAVIECLEFDDKTCTTERRPSEISAWVSKSWQKIDQIGPFIVFKNPRI